MSILTTYAPVTGVVNKSRSRFEWREQTTRAVKYQFEPGESTSLPTNSLGFLHFLKRNCAARPPFELFERQVLSFGLVSRYKEVNRITMVQPIGHWSAL